MEKTANLRVFYAAERVKEIYSEPQACSIFSREYLESNVHLLDTPEKKHRMEMIQKALKKNPSAQEFALLGERVLAI